MRQVHCVQHATDKQLETTINSICATRQPETGHVAECDSGLQCNKPLCGISYNTLCRSGKKMEDNRSDAMF